MKFSESSQVYEILANKDMSKFLNTPKNKEERARFKLTTFCLASYDANPWVGNYFRSRATLHLYFCLAGQISVKKANSKLKN